MKHETHNTVFALANIFYSLSWFGKWLYMFFIDNQKKTKARIWSWIGSNGSGTGKIEYSLLSQARFNSVSTHIQFHFYNSIYNIYLDLSVYTAVLHSTSSSPCQFINCLERSSSSCRVNFTLSQRIKQYTLKYVTA